MNPLDDESPRVPAPQLPGVARAVVTNNQDPERLGRVRVRFLNLPAVADSAWARIATPLAGAGYGLFCLPEVDDEVLVAFEHDDLDKPYVIGALWNGTHLPPANNADGQNNLRVLRSRSGHVIRLDDTAGAEQIVIQDKSGATTIVLDTKTNAITITARQDVRIRAGGNIALRSDGDVDITCANFHVEAREQAAITASSAIALDCMPGIKLNRDGLVVT